MSNEIQLVRPKEVRRRVDAVADGIADGAEDLSVYYAHLYPEPLLESHLLLCEVSWRRTRYINPVLAKICHKAN